MRGSHEMRPTSISTSKTRLMGEINMTIVRPRPPAPKTSASSLVAPTVTKPLPPSRKRPVPSELPKEEQEHAKKRQEINELIQGGTEPQASEPVASARITESRGLGEDTEGTEQAGQVSLIPYQKMGAVERHALWKRLNRGTPEHMFVTVLRQDALPKRVAREDSAGIKPAGKGILWCCYCGDWTTFENFSYLGSHRCTGCGMSTKDFHIRSANHLWKADL